MNIIKQGDSSLGREVPASLALNDNAKVLHFNTFSGNLQELTTKKLK